MPEVNIYKNPPPRIRPGQDLDGTHWSRGHWKWVDKDEWEYDPQTQDWIFHSGYHEFVEGGYWAWVESSNVRAIRYDIHQERLYVWFSSGHIYEYFEVPEKTALAMFHCDSMGGFRHTFLKAYGYNKLR
jgi:hypothetical protein